MYRHWGARLRHWALPVTAASTLIMSGCASPAMEHVGMGVGRVRCDEPLGPRTTQSVATISRSLRGILRSPTASRFRVCRLGYTEVPCDGLHTAELVYPYIKFTGAELKRNRGYRANKVET